MLFGNWQMFTFLALMQHTHTHPYLFTNIIPLENFVIKRECENGNKCETCMGEIVTHCANINGRLKLHLNFR